jgi:hypothetical protein
MKCFEKYPFWMVFISNLVSILIYLIGAFIIYEVGLVWLALYLIFILFLEFKLIKGHCPDCYYYGKICVFGKGKISSMFFKKGNTNNFCKKQVSWKDILPDFLVALIPVIAGIIIIINNFDWLILLSIIALLILAFGGSGMIRTQLACKYCKQREIGCPAQKLFDKNK